MWIGLVGRAHSLRRLRGVRRDVERDAEDYERPSQKPLMPTTGDQAMMYMSVVHGSRRKPSRPQTQLSIAASGLSPNSHHATSAMRGPRP